MPAKPSKNFWAALPRPIIALAPMAGVTDHAFRLICKSYGADVVYTEMISAAGLFYHDPKTSIYLRTSARERPAVAQLFGFDPRHFAVAAPAVTAAGFSGLDINFGCPARKVVKNFSGSALMDDPTRARAILKAAIAATTLPVSIKIRLSKGQTTAPKFLSALKGLPLAAIMLHARSFERGFSGAPDWNSSAVQSSISAARQYFPSAALLINGGLDSPAIAHSALLATGADGLGLARGVWGRPWTFRDIKSALSASALCETPNTPIVPTGAIPTDWPALKRLILRHARLVLKDSDHLIEFRKHLLWYVSGFPGAKHLRQSLSQIKTYLELQALLLKTYHPPTP